LSPFVPLGAAPDPARAIIPSTASIRAAMEAIDRDVSRIALLVGAGGELVGTVTDGDARRAILAGTSLDSPVSSIMKAQPVVAERDMTDDEIVALMLTRSVRQVPVVDESGRVLDIKLLDRMRRTPGEPVPVFLLAGGSGRRAGVITGIVPSPLAEGPGRPIRPALRQDPAVRA